MKPRIHVITLAVADLDRALAFYRDGLGLATEGLIGTEFPGNQAIPDGTTAVFHLDGGLMLSIYPRSVSGNNSSRFATQPTVSCQRCGVANGVPSFGDATSTARPSLNRCASGPNTCGRSTRLRRTNPPRECVITSKVVLWSGKPSNNIRAFSSGVRLRVK
jgi:catechol 2,3-dioxygenase-like lactoylglutathione lyase family enzyme